MYVTYRACIKGGLLCINVSNYLVEAGCFYSRLNKKIKIYENKNVTSFNNNNSYLLL